MLTVIICIQANQVKTANDATKNLWLLAIIIAGYVVTNT